MDDRVEGIVAHVVDDDLLHPRIQRLQDLLDEVVGHRPRRGDLLQLERDGVGLEEPDPDGQRALLLLVAQDEYGHVRERFQRQPLHFHLQPHGAPPRPSRDFRYGPLFFSSDHC